MTMNENDSRAPCSLANCGHMRQLDAIVDLLGMPRGTRSVLDELRARARDTEELTKARARIVQLEGDLHDAIVREREAEARARAADVFVQQVPDGFPGEIDVCDATDGHSHHYVPTSTLDTELNLIVEHIEKCANVIAGTSLPHAVPTARSLHMLATALGDHKAHRKEAGRNVASEIVDVLRKVGQGSPTA